MLNVDKNSIPQWLGYEVDAGTPFKHSQSGRDTELETRIRYPTKERIKVSLH